MTIIFETAKQQIDALLAQKDYVTVAIDGKCTSGKTTLASLLAAHFDCNVFHTDDYFLQPHQRTPERLAQVGGNVDYERFFAEILTPLSTRQPFSYRPYDCKCGQLAAPVCIRPKRLNIIEGTYSHHPYFGAYADWKLILSVDEKTQHARILQRPTHLHARFFEEWIPMENLYFAHLQDLNKK